MSAIIVDSSALMRSVQTRPDAPHYRNIISRSDCYAPTLIMSEIANAVWKTARFQNLDPIEAATLLSIMMAIPELLNDKAHIQDALNIAITHQHPVYDCLFIAMSRTLNAPILTADQKLRRKFQGDQFIDIH